MEKHPLISVIIPTFNRHRFIVEAVESVLSQEIDDLEVIVVDDGSTDGTRHLLEPYQQEIRYVYQDNQGVSAARNHGVRESRGEWLAFLDSDDRWVSGQLKARLEAAAGEDVFSFGGVEWFVDNAEDRHLLGQSESVTWPHCDTAGYVSDPVLDVAEGCYLHLGTLLCRKSAFLDVGWFDTGLCMGEDEDWFSRASLKKKFRYTSETVLCRRFHPGQISQEREESLRSLITVFARIRERTAGVHPQAYAAAGKRLAAKWSHLANRLATEARGSEAARAVRTALSLEPSNMKYLLKLVLLSGRGLAGDAMMRHAYMLFCKALHFQTKVIRRILILFNGISLNYDCPKIHIPFSVSTKFTNVYWKKTWKTEIVKRLFDAEEGVFIDVGANIGQTLLDFRVTHPNAQYVGFEPNISCVFYLKELISVNSFRNCQIIPAALNDETNCLSLYRAKDHQDDVCATINSDLRPERFYDVDHALCFRFDEIRHRLGIGRIDFIKIDAEGSELECLKGMRDSLQAFRPEILCEVLFTDGKADIERHRERNRRLMQFLGELNYDVLQLIKSSDDKSVVDVRRIQNFPSAYWTMDNKDLCDYLFIPREKVKKVYALFRGGEAGYSQLVLDV